MAQILISHIYPQRLKKSWQFSDMTSFEARLETTFVTDHFYISILCVGYKEA